MPYGLSLIRILGDGAGTVGGTVEGGIVQYVEDTVLTEADIAFYIAYTVFDARIYGCPVSYTHLDVYKRQTWNGV